ncbi:MAG: hypothetical protein GY820_34755 [Gammaproteobacteria bacterium]|nr:hypothetical protein [Gammaproteobacteria bacterium]
MYCHSRTGSDVIGWNSAGRPGVLGWAGEMWVGRMKSALGNSSPSRWAGGYFCQILDTIVTVEPAQVSSVGIRPVDWAFWAG